MTARVQLLIYQRIIYIYRYVNNIFYIYIYMCTILETQFHRFGVYIYICDYHCFATIPTRPHAWAINPELDFRPKLDEDPILLYFPTKAMCFVLNVTTQNTLKQPTWRCDHIALPDETRGETTSETTFKRKTYTYHLPGEIINSTCSLSRWYPHIHWFIPIFVG